MNALALSPIAKGGVVDGEMGGSGHWEKRLTRNKEARKKEGGSESRSQKAVK